ncbi:unnamed protein product [Ectocarpus sp. 12 AP-2014]
MRAFLFLTTRPQPATPAGGRRLVAFECFTTTTVSRITIRVPCLVCYFFAHNCCWDGRRRLAARTTTRPEEANDGRDG